MRHSLRSMVAASAVAAGTILGAIGLTAPAAGAMSISETAQHCKDAGGRWAREYGPDRQWVGYTCGYRDYYGDFYLDRFDRRGGYIETCGRYTCES